MCEAWAFLQIVNLEVQQKGPINKNGWSGLPLGFRYNKHNKSAKNQIIKQQQVHPAGTVEVQQFATETFSYKAEASWKD